MVERVRNDLHLHHLIIFFHSSETRDHFETNLIVENYEVCAIFQFLKPSEAFKFSPLNRNFCPEFSFSLYWIITMDHYVLSTLNGDFFRPYQAVFFIILAKSWPRNKLSNIIKVSLTTRLNNVSRQSFQSWLWPLNYLQMSGFTVSCLTHTHIRLSRIYFTKLRCL